MATDRFAQKAIRGLLLAAALLWWPMSASAFIYNAESIEGWVVDAETGKPIEGVILVAHWQLKGGIEGGTPVAQLQILETVTDQNGRYFFPAWGPKFRLNGQLRSESPRIFLFKPGYKYLGLDNEWYRGKDTSKSDWSGKTVKLERFTGTLAESAKHLRALNGGLWGVGHAYGEPCGWKSFLRMLMALDKQEREFEKAGIFESGVVSSLRANDSHLKAVGCGSIQDVVRR